MYGIKQSLFRELRAMDQFYDLRKVPFILKLWLVLCKSQTCKITRSFLCYRSIYINVKARKIFRLGKCWSSLSTNTNITNKVSMNCFKSVANPIHLDCPWFAVLCVRFGIGVMADLSVPWTILIHWWIQSSPPNLTTLQSVGMWERGTKTNYVIFGTKSFWSVVDRGMVSTRFSFLVRVFFLFLLSDLLVACSSLRPFGPVAPTHSLLFHVACVPKTLSPWLVFGRSLVGGVSCLWLPSFRL